MSFYSSCIWLVIDYLIPSLPRARTDRETELLSSATRPEVVEALRR